ncbi:MAG: hypothetical protein M3548_12175 [Actinomycetota bacterium]|nr:hypothetical protein [Actinomycetota bacterium]
MTEIRVIPESEVAWPSTLTPYIAAADTRRAVEWYVAVFDGHRRGEMCVMSAGTIGHTEIGIGDAGLTISDGGGGVVPVKARTNI